MLTLALAIVALVLGIIGVVEARGRNWAAWGVIALAALHLLTSLT